MQVDPTSRRLEGISVSTLLQTRRYTPTALENKLCVSTHATPRLYRIVEILVDRKPQTVHFRRRNSEEQISVHDYFLEHYNIVLGPCDVAVCSPASGNKNDRCFLPTELLRLFAFTPQVRRAASAAASRSSLTISVCAMRDQ